MNSVASLGYLAGTSALDCFFQKTSDARQLLCEAGIVFSRVRVCVCVCVCVCLSVCTKTEKNYSLEIDAS